MAKKIYKSCLIRDFISPLKRPCSSTLKDEKVPPNATAMAHILILSATLIIVLRGGWSVRAAARAPKTEPPRTTPRAIKKVRIILEMKEAIFITLTFV
jgi:hypothetical protein